MNPAFIIARKRDGLELSTAEINEFIRGFTTGEIPDYQMSAMAMAIFLRGMTTAETVNLTMAMLESGVQLDWDGDETRTVDKHSTGGIGDKVSLVLAPLLACCGLRVPMISGRGLGATGGTLDKLESIPGFRTNLSLDEMRQVVDKIGCVITGATSELAPADRKLYALRDVTATVASIPLITASIMSKKLAEGLDALVLDVKFGSGAFMKTLAEARELADSLANVGRQMGVATSALLTNMHQPLGRMVGNAVEVDESLAALRGEWPADLQGVTLALGGEALRLVGRAPSREAGAAQLTTHIESGAAFEKFRKMVELQGGRLETPRDVAGESIVVAPRDGFVTHIDAEALGRVVIFLGGGRRVANEQIDPSVGFEMLTRIGDKVHEGEPMMRLFAGAASASEAAAMLVEVVTIADERPPSDPLIVADTS